MRISDWSSYVCSSDLLHRAQQPRQRHALRGDVARGHHPQDVQRFLEGADLQQRLPGLEPQFVLAEHEEDRKRVVYGKSVSVRVDHGGRRMIKKTKTHESPTDDSRK